MRLENGTQSRMSGRLLSQLAFAVLLSVWLGEVMRDRVHAFGSAADDLLQAAVVAASASLLLWLWIVRPLRNAAEHERQETLAREGDLRDEAARQEFEARVHRALDMAGTEAACHRTVGRALERTLPGAAAEMLLADSSQAHLKTAIAVGPDGAGPGCGVPSPQDCPAVRRAQTLLFSSSEELDACPFLQNRAGGACSAVCVPVSVAGRAIGVLHATGADQEVADPDGVRRLEVVADRAGARIGLLRVMEQTHLQAATDPLTGLLNRRTIENRAHDLLRRNVPFAIAMGDLDHFKALNDTHGHDAGDRALRLFSRTLERSLRADDYVCRFGGEEFVVIFPERTAAEAASALNRVREELLVAVAAGAAPAFTVSFGVAESDHGASLQELIRIADNTLFRAKREGRNRVVVDGALPVPAP